MPRWEIITAEFIAWAKAYQGEKFHAVLCDPPYGLEFMGQEWDAPHKRTKKWIAPEAESSVLRGVQMPRFHQTVPFLADYQAWTTDWARALIPLLHPGALCFIFGGCRTHHRLMVGLEEAGFEIVDVIMYLFGSGFPKAQSIKGLLEKRVPPELRCACGKGHRAGDSLTSGLNVTDTVQGSQAGCLRDSRSCDEPPLWGRDSVPENSPSLGDVPEHIRAGQHRGGQEQGLEHNLGRSSNDRQPIADSSHREERQLGDFQSGDNVPSGTSLSRPHDADEERDNMARRKSCKSRLGDDSASSFPPEVYHKCQKCGGLFVDKTWAGYKTMALKPAYEPIICAKAPTQGKTYAELALEHGSGVLNVDEGRIGTEAHIVHGKEPGQFQPGTGQTQKNYHAVAGRYPANLALECTCETLEELPPDLVAQHSRSAAAAKSKGIYGDSSPVETGPARIVPAFRHTDPSCPAFMLDEQAGECGGGFATRGASTRIYGGGKGFTKATGEQIGIGDRGGPSRFFMVVRRDSSMIDSHSCGERNVAMDGSMFSGENLGAERCARCGSTAGCGCNIMGESHQGFIFTTETETQRTIGSKTLSLDGPSSIGSTTERQGEKIGSGTEPKSADVLDVNAGRLLKTSKKEDFETDSATKRCAKPASEPACKSGGVGTEKNTTPICEPTGNLVVRFRYQGKASRSEREQGCESLPCTKYCKGDRHVHNDHPTVKPLALCRWLATLLLPPDSVKPRRLLVPFAGSGSEMLGAMQAEWDEIVGIEQNAHYCEIARARLSFWEGRRETDSP